MKSSAKPKERQLETASPVSVRLEKPVLEAIRSLSRRTGKPVSRVIKEMLEMMLRMQRFPGIVFVEGPAGRRAHFAGTGLDVWEVIGLLQEYESVSKLREHFPQLSQIAVQVAKAYAEAYPEEIGTFFALNSQTPEQLKQKLPWLEVVRS